MKSNILDMALGSDERNRYLIFVWLHQKEFTTKDMIDALMHRCISDYNRFKELNKETDKPKFFNKEYKMFGSIGMHFSERKLNKNQFLYLMLSNHDVYLLENQTINPNSKVTIIRPSIIKIITRAINEKLDKYDEFKCP